MLGWCCCNVIAYLSPCAVTAVGSASVGGIAGGVIGALGVIILSIIVVAVIIVLSRARNKGNTFNSKLLGSSYMHHRTFFNVHINIYNY